MPKRISKSPVANKKQAPKKVKTVVEPAKRTDKTSKEKDKGSTLPKEPVKKTGKPSKQTDEVSTVSEDGQKRKSGKIQQTPTSSSKGNPKMTLSSIPSAGIRQYRERRPGRPPGGKRLAAAKEMPGKHKTAFRHSLDPCENSNDSGLGFDHHTDGRQSSGVAERLAWGSESTEAKRPRLDIKLEHDDVNDGYSFPETIRTCKENTALIRTAPSGSVPPMSISNNQHNSSGRGVPRYTTLSSRQTTSPPIPLTTQLTASSRFMNVSLNIVKQPEQQHRARYQTEGSRGAVKDREGNGFPIVQLNGYFKPATLQIFIGTDVGKVSPHMFYQACKVSGKNSTPCSEKKIDGTCVIELQLDPSKEMSATCDCVGILKERNVDVEHRFPDQLGNRSKKKSTKCRMIFRTTLTMDDGTEETLQACSHPIVCTQPPGVPEICKKSLTSCPASGGLELFVLGKNFLKDTKVFFQQIDDDRLIRWEQTVAPDKEYLQQTHFVCVVPPYRRTDITEPVTVRLCVLSSGKTSESHHFVYTPVNGSVPSVSVEAPPPQTPFFNKMLWSSSVSKRDQDLGMMPPPDSNLVPLSTRRPSLSISQGSEVHSPPLHSLKQEYIDENSQNSIIDASEVRQERYRHISESSMDVNHGDSNVSMINENSIDMMHHNGIGSEMMHNINENSNLSINENSIDLMVRRNSLSRPPGSMCENSMDVNVSNSNMSIMNEDSSCSTVMHYSSSVMTDRMVLSQPSTIQQTNLIGATKLVDDLKGIDLRVKFPMATVADLASTSAPSMATLQNFGVTETMSGPLPAQSAQSVENFLTKIESKSTMSNTDSLALHAMPFKNRLTQTLLNTQNCNGILTSPSANLSQLGMNPNLQQPVFLSSQQPFTVTTDSEAMNVAKSEAAAIAESSPGPKSTITAMSSRIESTISSTPINTARLDALVNSTVESHMRSPTRSETSLQDVLMSEKLSIAPQNTRANLLITSEDVMLNSQPPIVKNPITSPVLGATHSSTNLSSEVILNSQISPSSMCHTAGNTLPQDTLLPSTICSSSVIENNLITSPGVQQSPHILLPVDTSQGSPARIDSIRSPIAEQLALVDPEKAVLIQAAVDLLETQKKLSELESTNMMEVKEPMLNKIYMNNLMSANNTSPLNQLQSTGNNFIQPQLATSPVTNTGILLNGNGETNTKPDFFIPVPVKEMQMTASNQVNEKKNEDRMIPQSFTSLTENELINFINPSCFDQV